MDKNPYYRLGPPAMVHTAAFTIEQITNRVQNPHPPPNDKTSVSSQSPENENKSPTPSKPADFLDHCLAIKSSNPSTVNDGMVMLWLLNNVVAGSDTVATAMNAILYHLLRNPQTHTTLLHELDSLPPSQSTQYAHRRKLPYLSAVISKAMRLFPSTGLPLERVVPPGEGLKPPDGRVIPPGTVVGMNAWVLHHEPVFGEDTDAFRPERWI